MYRNKKEVDKHVENLSYKLSAKEFNNRAYSIARLYFEVGDYGSCQKYVEQYLTQKDNNAAAHKLLGQALQRQGFKEKALDQFKISLDLDPSQTTLILDICELLTDPDITINPSRAKYWCEKAEATFPKHCITFRLHERLLSMTNSDPEAVVKLLKTELAARPKDTLLHVRLLHHFLQLNKIKEAFNHGCTTEFTGNHFTSNYTWYENLSTVLSHESHNVNDWAYQLLLLTVKEKLCVLSLTDTPTGNAKSLVEANDLLFDYDQAIQKIVKAGASPGFGEFHASLLQHHKGQLAFHAATYLLKKAKKNQLSWRDATAAAAPLMLLSWYTVPLDLKVNWLNIAPENQKRAVQRWYFEGAFRCSQSGHYILADVRDKAQSYLDHILHFFSGANWRDKLFEKLFPSKDQQTKIKTSYLASNALNSPTLRLPRKIEVEAYDNDAQNLHPNSLHNFVWILLNYKNYAQFNCTTIDMLTPKCHNHANCGPETLTKLDVQAFLYCATLTAKNKIISVLCDDKPKVLPANITELLCPVPQIKWWDCVYKFTQNELGAELTDIRATISRGIEVVRCIDNHGLDPELLCLLGRIFSECAKLTTNVDAKTNLEIRASTYYSSAIPLLESLKKNIAIKFPHKRMFDYLHKYLEPKDLLSLIDESKVYVAVNHLNDCEYEKVVNLLTNLKSARAYYYIGETYKRMAKENSVSNVGSSDKSKTMSLLAKAKSYAYKALDRVKEEENRDSSLYGDIQELIEDIEVNLTKVDDNSSFVINDIENKYSSDDNFFFNDYRLRGNHVLRNVSSTPRYVANSNTTNYRTAVSTSVLDTTPMDQQCLERIENQIKNLQKRDVVINDFMEQSKGWFDENRQMGNQIISTIQSNIQNTTDQFKLLKISVDQVKDQIDECRNECKDVGDMKKQIAELKKEVTKLKKASSEQAIDDNDLYNLDDDNTPTFTPQLPFGPSVIPQFNQRIVPPLAIPPNPYQQLYNQNLFNLYSQFSQFAQPPPAPGAPPIFDANRTPVNYAGVYPTSDQMYLDVAHLVPPSMPVPAMPTVPVPPIMTTVAAIPTVSIAHVSSVVSTSKLHITSEKKESQRPIASMPINVVITSSDPLPTITTAPAPVLSVTIPPKHIKGPTTMTAATPHNYQIQMPLNDKMPPPVFNFPASSGNLSGSTNWNTSSVFQTTPQSIANIINNASLSNKSESSFDDSRTVVDGMFHGISPNTSINKSRTLSEKSNTSVENYDPCPDFKPIIPLPAEVQVTTGEENELTLFSSRAKLFRFVDKQWKERGIGEMKLLEHKATGKVRVLMRREQVHKICANHLITPEMEINPMKNETKAYFWVANDFADERLVLEKFCVRFKTADIALKFYETFENARSKANTSISTPTKEKSDVASPQVAPAKENTVTVSQPNKTVVGGFTFSSTPTFKPVKEESKSDTKPTESATPKVNVFSGFSFKSTTSSPFSNLFNVAPKESNVFEEKHDASDKHNTSDTVEEFEPNVEFKPVVPLPALVEQKTGEEDEIILFEYRAKLLRFDASNKEWKERGLGNIKILAHKDNDQKVRLLMRREQVKKVCCNHSLTNDMVFQKMPNMDKAVTWCAKDFSEGELIPETFCLRFKTVQICDDFLKVVQSAQSKIKDQSKAVKEVQNAAKQNTQIGFGDKFKPKEGSWHCNSCYTNNLESFDKCACCEQPKPDKEITVKAPTQAATNWGDKFKPKPGTWECQQCLIRNESSLILCSACNSPKDPSKPKTEEPQSASRVTAVSGWGDKFKPKEGTWECKECLIRNESNLINCSACNSPKDPNAPKPSTGLVSTPKFNFGIPTAVITVDTKTSTATNSIFDGTGAHKFNFGIPSSNTATQSTPSVLQFGENQPKQTYTFGIQSELSPNTFGIPMNEPVNFSLKKDEDKTPVKPALLPTPQKEETTLGGKGSSFDFVFKPKTVTKGKSPNKTPKSDKGGDSDDNEYASEDEGHHIHFNPIIPLPDKVEVVTGEENEDELYGHRAKLFRFTSGEWKERGIGVVKILKHKETGKVRVVMRREQVLKICLNHALTQDIIYSPKDEKTWLFAANDFSEGELSLQQFCLRFKNHDIAMDFMNAINNARGGKPAESKKDDKKDSDSDDVVFVNEIQASNEDKEKAKKLMLPENFYTYKNKDPCQGCRGCEADEEPKPLTIASLLAKPSVLLTGGFYTPNKTSTPSVQSPAVSLYGTPTTVNRNVDASIFRTPLESITGQNVFSTPMNVTKTDNNVTDKENTLTPSSLSQQDTTVFTTPSSKGVVLAPPKLNTSKTNESVADVRTETQTPTVFGEQKPVFGNLNQSSNKSMFNFSLDNSNKESNSEIKSIFGGETEKPVNLFSGGPGSIFGPKSTNTSIFGSTNTNVPTTTPSQSIFGSNQNTTAAAPSQSIFGSNESKPLFGSFPNATTTTSQTVFGSPANTASITPSQSIFGSTVNTTSTTSSQSVFGSTANTASTTSSQSIHGTANQITTTTTSQSVFGSINPPSTTSQSIFGSTNPTSISTNQSIFGSTNTSSTASIFGNNNSTTSTASSIFAGGQSVFGNGTSAFGNGPSVFGKQSGGSTWSFAAKTEEPKPNQEVKPEPKTEPEPAKDSLFKVDNSLSFAALSSTGPGFSSQANPDFQWEGAGQQLFGGAQKRAGAGKEARNTSGAGDAGEGEGGAEGAGAGGDEEYDPHYEPIVPLPDIVVVTTGEEDEEKIYGERAKLYRYDEKTREWKERGVGEMKVLYHPERNTYRLLLRREQVHKAVLNMLISMDLELLPMKNSDRAWTWAGRNFAESRAGDQETLAVRFKKPESAADFRDRVVECVRKLQVAAAEAIREEKEAKTQQIESVPPLRLPKHLQDSSRVDAELSSQVTVATQSSVSVTVSVTDTHPVGKRQVYFQEQEEEHDGDEEGEEEEEDYDNYENYEDYEDYYNEEDDESGAQFSCLAAATVARGDALTACPAAQVQVLLAADTGPRVLLADGATGELLADMLIHTDTEFQLNGEQCSWTGLDYSTNEVAEKTVTVDFPDEDTAMHFYDSCETSKAAAFASTESES